MSHLDIVTELLNYYTQESVLKAHLIEQSKLAQALSSTSLTRLQNDQGCND